MALYVPTRLIQILLQEGEAFRGHQAKDREGKEEFMFAIDLMASQYLENGAFQQFLSENKVPLKFNFKDTLFSDKNCYNDPFGMYCNSE